ncbi:MAG: FAD-dependent oxidoreductase, partial [Anaerolineales bacterium]
MIRHVEVAIIGAGPAGLSAAHALVQRGVDVLVLEKAHTVGGIARTEIHNGYHFDIGGHRFFTRHPSVQRL